MFIYIAGPLFSVAERNFNQELKKKLLVRLGGIDIILPQEESTRILSETKSLKGVFNHCVDSIKKCDLVVAVLDGADVDSGTSFEIGFAYGLAKPIIGIRTDFRKSEDKGVNLMLSRSMTKLFYLSSTTTSMEDVADNIANWIINNSIVKINKSRKNRSR